MLQFKDTESTATSIRHYGFHMKKFIEDTATDVFEDDSVFDGMQDDVKDLRMRVMNITRTLGSELLAECKNIASKIDGAQASPVMFLLTVDDKQSSIVRRSVTRIYVLNENRATKFDEALTVFVSRILSQSDVSSFVEFSTIKRNEKLQVLLEEHKLSNWCGLFQNDTWREKNITKLITDDFEKHRDIVEEWSFEEMTAELMAQHLLERVETSIVHELADSMVSVAQSRLVANDSLQQLLGTPVASTIERTMDRLYDKHFELAHEFVKEIDNQSSSGYYSSVTGVEF